MSETPIITMLDLGVFLLSLTLIFGILKMCEVMENNGTLSVLLSRKIVHISCGFVTMLLWPFYTDSQGAIYLAAVIPFFHSLRFILLGFGILKDERVVKSLSRSGNRRELLYGPLSYGLVFLLGVIFGWRNSIHSIFSLVLLWSGDGFADVIGRRYAKVLGPLPHNNTKTYAGSLAFWISSWLFMEFFFNFYQGYGFLREAGSPSFERSFKICMVSLIGALVESSTNSESDNWFIYFGGIAASNFFFG